MLLCPRTGEPRKGKHDEMKRKRHHYPYLPTRILSPPSAFTITYQSSNLTYQSSNLTLNHHTTILNPKIIDPTHQKILPKEREKESKTGINASLPSLPPLSPSSNPL